MLILLYNFERYLLCLIFLFFFLFHVSACAYESDPDLGAVECYEEKSLEFFKNSAYLDLLDKSGLQIILTQEEFAEKEM